MKDGGAAFPEHKMIHDKTTGELLALSCNGGMTLRDYFAGQALVELNFGNVCNLTDEFLASRAYMLADAMLAEREKTNGKDNN